MKILAFSDLHLARARAADIVAASDEADIVVGAGDFCNARQGLDQAMDMLRAIAVPIVAVAGNAESAEELKSARLPNMTVLHGESCEIGGVAFFGLGGAVPETPFGSWSYDISEADAAGLLDRCRSAHVMVLHSPPKGVADLTSTGLSVGSTAIRDAIARVQPRLAVCGHIHDSWGEEGRIGTTRVCNLGPKVNWFESAP